MKYIVYILMVTAMFSCKGFKNPMPEHTTAVTVIDGRVAPGELGPAPCIMSLFGFDVDPNQGGVFHLVRLVNGARNPTIDVTVDEARDDIEAAYHEKMVQGFYQNVANVISGFDGTYKINTEKQHSEIYASVIKALRELTVRHAAHSYLIIYSSLLEQSSIIHLYSWPNHKKILTDPEAIADKLEGKIPLPSDLRGTVVIFVRNNNSDDSALYTGMLRAYSLLLSRRGATVILKNNNNFQTYE